MYRARTDSYGYFNFVKKYFGYKSRLLEEQYGLKYNTMDICMDLYFDYENGIREYNE
jgi:hypothetical protein